MKNENTPDDDDEFARYLASYLAEREDYFINGTWYDGPAVDRYKLEATIRKFISELP